MLGAAKENSSRVHEVLRRTYSAIEAPQRLQVYMQDLLDPEHEYLIKITVSAKWIVALISFVQGRIMD